MTDTMTAQENYASKIEKLLRRAEHVNTPPEEADSCIAKAQELMQIYAIDEAMINKARGIAAPDKIVERRTYYTGSYRMALYDIGSAVAKANGCKPLITKQTVHDGKNSTCLTLIGFESDVKRVQLLDASLQIQCAVALKAWWKTVRDNYSFLSGMEQFKIKRDFIFGFAQGVTRRLAEANRLAQAAAAENETARTGATTTDAQAGVSLVLRDKKAQVNDWIDETYGSSLRKVSRNYSNGIGNGRGAGHEAGRSADLGATHVGGQKAIG